MYYIFMLYFYAILDNENVSLTFDLFGVIKNGYPLSPSIIGAIIPIHFYAILHGIVFNKYQNLNASPKNKS